jgi:diguanylate cyclase (GGDEF)-like protein
MTEPTLLTDRESRPATLPPFPFGDTAALDLLSAPVWVHDGDRACNVYANAAGLRFWGCASVDELEARSHADMSATSRARLDALFSRIARGERLVDRWTFYPLGQPVTVDGTISGVRLDAERVGLLFEAAPAVIDPIDRRAAEALRYASVLATIYDDAGRVLFRNPAAERAYPGDAHRFVDRFEAVDAGVALWTQIVADRPANAIVRVKTSSGLRWHGLDARAVTDPVTGRSSVLVNERDVTALKTAEARIAERERQLVEAQVIARLGDWRLDVATLEGRLSPQVAAMFALGREAVSAEELRTLLGGASDGGFAEALERVSRSGGSAEAVSRLDFASGRRRYVWTRFAARYGERGDISEVVGVARDISDEVRARERIDFLAMHDSVTQLANRVRFGEALVAAVGRDGAAGGCLIVIDLDGFKEINDTRGHDAGDQVLVEIGRRLTAAAGPGELVARLGGDEFGMILTGSGGVEEFRRRAADLLERVASPVVLDVGMVAVGASVGLAAWPRDGDTPEALMQNADLALYSAKLDGGGIAVFYAPEMRVALEARRWVGSELPAAIAAGAIEVHFQPIVALATRRLAGFEALVRWRHDVRGLVPPDDFVQLADGAGLGSLLGAHVLEQALGQLRAWLDAGFDPGRIAVNLGAGHIAGGRARADVAELLSRFALTSGQLELEVTESVTLRPRSGGVFNTIDALHDLGVGIVLDDFGTGQASLTHLNRLPIDRVKIDRSFIANLQDRREAAIVRAIVSLAAELGMSVVAEGIETEHQATLLAEAGCTFAQGFLFGRPMTADDATAWMATNAVPG